MLTVADIRAVGPGVWNGWKAQLLRELYYEAEALMSGGDHRPGAARRSCEGGPGANGWPIVCRTRQRRAALARSLRHLLACLRRGAARAHARLLRREAEQRRRLFALDARGEHHIPRRDRDRGLHARSSRPVLAARRRHRRVRAAPSSTPRCSPTDDGFALDVFSVQDADGGPFGDGARIERAAAHHGARRCRREFGRAPRCQARRRKRAPAAFRGPARASISTTRPRRIATVMEVEGPRPSRPALRRDARAVQNPACRFPRRSSPPMASARWTSSMCATVSATKSPTPERLNCIEDRLLTALAGDLLKRAAPSAIRRDFIGSP